MGWCVGFGEIKRERYYEEGYTPQGHKCRLGCLYLVLLLRKHAYILPLCITHKIRLKDDKRIFMHESEK